MLKNTVAITIVLAGSAITGFIATRELVLTQSLQAAAATTAINAGAAEMIALRPDEAVVAGASDRSTGVWVLARHSADATLVVYHVDRVGTRRISLPLPEAGRLGGIVTAADGSLWVGAGDRLVAIDAASGQVTRAVSLPSVGRAAAHAQRTPDGTVLGLGQITSLAADPSGIWVARYGSPSVTLLATGSAQPQELQMPIDADPSQLSAANGRIWFTTNFGPDDRLGAFVGIIDPTSQRVTIVPAAAASLTVGPDGVYAIARDVLKLEGSTGTLLSTRPLSAPVDAAASAVDAGGRLVLRGAKQTQLHIYDQAGAEVRSISYSAGSFFGRGGLYASTAPLAFLFVTSDGSIWFAPQSGAAVFRGS